MEDKQKIAILVEALLQIRNGKRNESDVKTASEALDKIIDKETASQIKARNLNRLRAAFKEAIGG